MGTKLGYRLKSRYRLVLVAMAIVFISIACSNLLEPNPQIKNQPLPEATELNIWWEQGYNLAEDEAIRNVIKDWQDRTSHTVKLSFFTNDELTAKTERAVQANQTPDLMMTLKGDQILYSRLAWQDKLEDVSDIIKPVQDSYSAQTLQAITYSNPQQKKRSYYGVPIYQSTIFIFYWQKLLASVGLSPNDIPQDWDGFWQFWQQAQTKLRTEQNLDIYGLGFTLASDKIADDTNYLFEQILEAYDVNLLNSRGEIDLDRPQVREGIIKCLNWYAELYRQGYIPPDAVRWSNIDNNRSLLNRLVLMTPNPTLSIPATVLQDAETYYNRLGIMEFPHKPSGKPMRYLMSIQQAVIFKDSPHKTLAKDFLSYFIQPEVTLEYIKATGCRNQPVQKSVWTDPYLQNTNDPYISTATKIITKGETRLSYYVINPAYSEVLAENIWGKALTQVTAWGVNPEQATDLAIARIKEIFQNWEQ